MKLTATTNPDFDISDVTDLLSDLRSYEVKKWPVPTCQRYPAGYQVSQSLRSPQVYAYSIILKITEPCTFYLHPGTTAVQLLFLLKGTIHFGPYTLSGGQCGIYRLKSTVLKVTLAPGLHHCIVLQPAGTLSDLVASETQRLHSFDHYEEHHDLELLKADIEQDIRLELSRIANTGSTTSSQLFKIYAATDNIISLLFRVWENQEKDQQEQNRILAAAENYYNLLAEDPSLIHSLKRYAKRSAIDERQLSLIFLQLFHERPKTLLMQRIYQKGLSLIEDSTMKMEEISIQLGFTDRRTFSRSIKKKFGRTPDEIRKNALRLQAS